MQDKITIADAPDCLNTNDKAMWVLGYQAVIEARSACLLQIQEPPTKTEALAHYSQQAILAMDEAAPAAAPVVLPEPDAVIKEVMRLIADLEREAADVGYGHGSQRLVNEKRAAIESKMRALLAGVSAPAGQAVEPFGYVNTLTGLFFKDVEPCRKTNEGHWRTVFTAPKAQADARDALTPAARDVLAERARQISAEGWTPERDDAYNRGVLAEAGGIYALHAYDPRRAKEVPEGWPWVDAWWKPSESPRRNLEKAGALILAEIERFDRAIAAAKGE